MRRAGIIMMGSVMMVAALLGTGSAQAEGRSIKQLPSDLVQCSLLWTEVPKQMVEVGKDDGPVAALTWGPVKGTAVMVASATQNVWDVMKSNHATMHDSSRKNPNGPVVRYEF